MDHVEGRLVKLLAAMSQESQFHLETALRAHVTPGVGGHLVVTIPRRAEEHVQVRWVGGGTQLSLPL